MSAAHTEDSGVMCPVCHPPSMLMIAPQAEYFDSDEYGASCSNCGRRYALVAEVQDVIFRLTDGNPLPDDEECDHP